MTDSIEKRALAWAIGRDTGSSSKAIMAVMTGNKPESRHDYPSDGSDLGRCLRLLDLIPEWKPRMGEMRAISPQWAALVDHWDELSAKHAAKHPRLYERMRDILRAIEKADKGMISFEGGAIIFGDN
jgi:hypothetical protein